LPHSLPGPAYAPPLHSFPTRRSSDLAAVFHLIWFLILESPLIAAGLTAERIGGFVGVTFALWAIPLGVGLLLVQVFKRWGYRGRSEEHTLNSSHVAISYAVFCLKKKS